MKDGTMVCKRLAYLLFMIWPGIIHSQIEPFDTTLYSNGNIKSIFFRGTIPYRNSETHQTFSFSQPGQLIADTIFRYRDRTYPEIRNYYPDSQLVWRTTLPFAIEDTIGEYLHGWHFRFRNKKTFEISCVYDNRGSLQSLSMYEFDYQIYNSVKLLATAEFEPGSALKSTEMYLGEYGSVRINFTRAGLIESFVHGLANSTSYTNNFFAFNKSGLLIETKDYLDGKKNGEWLYFDNTGEITKKENWKGDKLMKEVSY
jgi:hypothetical protein